jgi:predicted phosphoribosyltransferase
VFLVRKLGLPGFSELAVGAIANRGVVVRYPALRNPQGLLDHLIAWLAARERPRLEQRGHAYRGNAPSPDVRGKTVILVDEGLATGTTMRAWWSPRSASTRLCAWWSPCRRHRRKPALPFVSRSMSWTER